MSQIEDGDVMSDQKETAILKAALEVFANHGFERATMDEIALKAHVAKGTLFYRYKSKEDLFISLIHGAIDLFLSQVRQESKNLETARARLAKAIEIQTQLSFENPQFTKLLLSEVWGNQERQCLFRTSLDTYLNYLKENIDQGIMNQEIKKTNSSLLASSIFGMTAAATLHLQLSQNRIDLDGTVKELQRYLLNGI
jgi:TetR/AcrR family transcriptional regulator